MGNKIQHDVVFFEDTDKIHYEYWCLVSQRFVISKIYHREDGPAYIEYCENGRIEIEEWRSNGKLHKENGPAYISYYENGNISGEQWHINGIYHREYGPAHIEYYKNGNIAYKQWIVNGIHHREDGPAIISYYEDGDISQEEWRVDGKLHRTDGPAYITYQCDYWCINGKKIDMSPYMHLFKPNTWEFKSKEDQVAFKLIFS